MINTTTLAPRIKGIPIALAGQAFILPPASFATLDHFSDSLDGLNARLAANGGQPRIKDMAVIADLVHACLLRNYPDLTREFVGAHLGLEENVIELVQKCLDGGGELRKTLEAAAARQSAAQEGGKLGESTGTASPPTS